MRRVIGIFMLSNIRRLCFQSHISRSCSSNAREIKRFYKDITLTKSNGGFEINLDRFKLRTPLGNIVQIPSEPLALAVSEEWRTQGKIINKHNMYLTSLTNKCIDRKDTRDQELMINKMLEFLNTDTVCFRADEPPELMQMQEKMWNPIIKWTEERFHVQIPTTYGLALPSIPKETTHEFTQYLKSFPDWALVGYEESVECLKSFVVGTAIVNKHISIDDAVRLSCLELEFQTSVWGTVEWKHTIDEIEMKARLAAAMLFVHFNSTQYNLIKKDAIKNHVN